MTPAGLDPRVELAPNWCQTWPRLPKGQTECEVATVGPPGRLLGTPQNDQKSVLHTYRGLYSTSWGPSNANSGVFQVPWTRLRDLDQKTLISHNHAPGRRFCALPPIRHLVVRVRVQVIRLQHTTEAPGENPGSGVTRLSGIYLGTDMNPGSSGPGEKR